MRWRFVDRITGFEPWQSIAGHKTVSLEEYYLLQPLGCEGVLPQSLLIECCVELARWLAAASTEFDRFGQLAAIEGFEFDSEAALGDVLQIDQRVVEMSDPRFSVESAVAAETGFVAAGRLTLSLVPARGAYRPGELEDLWREIHGAT